MGYCSTISGGNIMKTEIKYDEEIEKFHLPRWNELPNVDLYLDQVVTLINSSLSEFLSLNTNRLHHFL